MGPRKKDALPCAEPHMPDSRDEALLCFGNDLHDEDNRRNWFKATDAAPGTDEKIEVLRQRAANGWPLWHPKDRCDYKGWTNPIPQRILDRDM